MKLERVDLIHVRLPLVAPFETSLGRIAIKDAVLLRGAGEGLTGWSEVAAWFDPWYSYETIETSLYVLEKYLVPAALSGDLRLITQLDPWPSVRGYPMAKAALQALGLDMLAQADGQSLARWLGGTRELVAVGISLGIEGDVASLIARIEQALAEGYKRIKLKIRPGWDLDVVAAIRHRFGPDVVLSVDANGAYRFSDAARLSELDRFGLAMLEQPLQHDDLDDHAALATLLRTPICLDESVPSDSAVRRALQLGSGSIINIKHGRVGGPIAARAIHDTCVAAGVPVFCGGMLETGVGRAANVALASLPGFTLPGDLSASRRYFHEDIVAPAFELEGDGYLRVPTGPGLGITVDEARVRDHTVTARKISRHAVVA